MKCQPKWQPHFRSWQSEHRMFSESGGRIQRSLSVVALNILSLIGEEIISRFLLTEKEQRLIERVRFSSEFFLEKNKHGKIQL